MTKFTAAGTGALAATFVAFGLGLSAQTNPAPKKPAPAPAGTPAPKPAMAVAHKAPPAPAAAPQPDLTKQYCVGCHSEKGKAGGLSLVSFDPSNADQSADVAETHHPQAAARHDAAAGRAAARRRGAVAVRRLARDEGRHRRGAAARTPAVVRSSG